MGGKRGGKKGEGGKEALDLGLMKYPAISFTLWLRIPAMEKDRRREKKKGGGGKRG